MGTSGADTLRKLYHEPWPITSLAETGDRIGITRERVRQLVRQHKIPTYLNRERPSKYRCRVCGKHANPGSLCQRCWRWSHYSILQCPICTSYFARQNSQVRVTLAHKHGYRGNSYCSYRCAGLGWKRTASDETKRRFWEATPQWRASRCQESPTGKHIWMRVCTVCGKEKA